MKRALLIITVFCLCLCLFPGRVLAQKVLGLYDRNFDKSKLHVQRVAIIPNRLPLTMQEPEYWRQYNWRRMAEAFTRRGFEVVAYKPTLKAVFDSSLPLEDTGASEEKFNTCAQMLDVDVIVMPYYSIGFGNQNYVVLVNKSQYVATISLQFYSRHHNMFFLRSDSSRRYTVETFWQTLGGGLAAYGFQRHYSHWSNQDTYIDEYENEALGWLGVGLMLYDVIKSFFPATTWWKKAFNSAIRHGLQPFFAVYHRGPKRR